MRGDGYSLGSHRTQEAQPCSRFRLPRAERTTMGQKKVKKENKMIKIYIFSYKGIYIQLYCYNLMLFYRIFA